MIQLYLSSNIQTIFSNTLTFTSYTVLLLRIFSSHTSVRGTDQEKLKEKKNPNVNLFKKGGSIKSGFITELRGI